MPANLRRICTTSVAFVLLCTGAVSATAQSPAEFFHDKTLKILIPGNPGAESSLLVLPFADFFSRHIPGNPAVVPQYMPGAGGSLAINYLYNVAAGDPLTIATPLAAVVIAQATGDNSVKYDVSKLNWIGRVNDITRVVYVWNTVAAHNFADLRSKPLVVGSTGRFSETFIDPAVMNELLGTKFKIVMGYKGAAAVNLAVESHETDGATATWVNLRNNHPDWLRDNRIRILAQIALTKNRELPDVPLLRDFATNDADRAVIEFMSSSSQIGNSFVAPPGVPAPDVAALRTAFDDTLKDPDYLAVAAKDKISIDELSGAALATLVDEAIRSPAAIVGRYKAAVAAQ